MTRTAIIGRALFTAVDGGSRGTTHAILSQMANNSIQLTLTFRALADPYRRLMLRRLSRGSAPANELVAPLPMKFPSGMKHLKVLEASGLVQSENR